LNRTLKIFDTTSTTFNDMCADVVDIIDAVGHIILRNTMF